MRTPSFSTLQGSNGWVEVVLGVKNEVVGYFFDRLLKTSGLDRNWMAFLSTQFLHTKIPFLLRLFL